MYVYAAVFTVEKLRKTRVLTVTRWVRDPVLSLQWQRFDPQSWAVA